MMRSKLRNPARIFAALLLAAAARPTAAFNLADLYFDPAVPGRGLSIHDQGGTLFATLFTYDATGKGIWYVAPNVVATSVDFDPCGTAHFSGRLHEANGPTLGSTTPPLTAREVGSLSFSTASFPDCSLYNRLTVRITINGTTTNVSMQRQTWASQPVEGRYHGSLVRFNACDSLPEALGGPIEITRTGTRLRVVVSNAPSTLAFRCTLEGEATQAGHHVRIEGTQICLVEGDILFSRPFIMENLVADDNGFTALVAYPPAPSIPPCGRARIGGARRFQQ